ncbi:N-acetyllactosaminide alpha-1,3-galactosyltransferase, partial [Nematolebias whitei]|uniref:N-acetyllactosaminide alpha-1,3-galactosyltransferase n=1 Tax=Nematolebias whitei TaxID=451745 RepID=UPI0018978229
MADRDKRKNSAQPPNSPASFRSRPAVQTRTSWNAPIVWELMFNANLFDQKHKKANTSVAVTVFAVGRYLEAYLKTFITSAERHFMLGLPVTYYVFTDSPESVSNFVLGPQRKLKVVRVDKYSRWQDISMMRMKTISETIENELRHSFTHVFCFDVDQEFKGRFGSEALGESVAMLHAHYYKLPKNRFTYDRNP